MSTVTAPRKHAPMNAVRRSCTNSQICCRRDPRDLDILTKRSRYNDNPMLRHGWDRSKGAVIETVSGVARAAGADSELHRLIVLSRNVVRHRVSREFNFRTIARYDTLPRGRLKLEGTETRVIDSYSRMRR